MPALQTYHFHSPGIFSGLTGTIDVDNAIIRGVSIITGGIVAEGHNLEVDDTTLKQLQACAKAKGKIPVTLDHGSGVKDLNGFITGFIMDGDKLRGDWHLLKTHDETIKMLERASVMPECFGLSVAFKGPKNGVSIGNGKMAARCEKLLSIDCVTRPAANEGLFSAKSVDSTDNDNMAKSKTDAATTGNEPAKEPTLADIAQLLNQVIERQDQQEAFINEQFAPEPTLEDLNGMTDEELQGLGLTRAEVDSAVAEAIAGAEEAEAAAAAANPDGAKGPEGELAGAGVATGAEVTAAGNGAASASPTFQALAKRVIQLEAREKARILRAEREASENEFASIDEKVNTLQEQRDQALAKVTELEAKNEALEVCVKTGTKPVKAGVNDGVRMFGVGADSKLHPFQVRVKELIGEGKTEAQAIQLAQKEDPARHEQWVHTLSAK